ncbi:GATA zinc finger domain-containing protein 10 [Drosophila biarmipes]|uniref:GATA zinc finger domain-containing protein 10 n=1 Tax=Drosophila biarmipes TaxID=125945 RepID=UPI0007E87392|nr:GATA zinc finger domain-containing protein 10 [Drosophila biarmipes]XP_050742037.1 GATA zinc finger domain-containing protein 10 [Drosophila biarmipes]
MHFWIDKRSQQCGFGRSRVAASLSHAGSGLSYGHPPRRTKSSSCSSNSAGGSGQSMPSVHRSLPQTPYDLHQPSTSRQLQSQSQSSYGNNNSQQQQQHLLQQHSSGGNSNNNNLAATGTTTTASNNNNASGIASSAAVLTGSGTIVPLVARGSHYSHHGSTRYQPRTQQQQQLLHQQQQQHQQQHQQQQHQQHYSYHHPQFGNMAVPMRYYDAHQQQQYSGNVYADDAYSAYHHTAHHQHSSNHSTSGSNNQRQSNAYATPRRHNSSSNMRHSAATATSTAAPAPSTAETATMASPAAAVAAAPAATMQNSNQLQQQHHALLHHADSQLLPGHLKCGMCASLVLASVFVAGTKFYFDHQGTGLEVLIFCAFSATFFLAACLVSLCRIPKGLLSSTSRTDGRTSISHTRGGNSSLTGSGSGTAQSAGCLLEMTEARYLEELQMSPVGGSASTAGPPPYHIAILLPEQTPATMGKQLPLDESPPPSYDKILV